MKALIIDDEPMPAKHLREMIKHHCFEIGLTEIIHSPITAMKHLSENEYDILFLDVEMPEMSGVEFLKQIQLPQKTAVIFTTAYSEYALDAFKANAIHYIMKPVEETELIKAVRKTLLKNQEGNSNGSDSFNTITVYDGEEYLIVKTADIIRLEADGSYTKIVLKEKNVLTSKRLGFYEEKLGLKKFMRCHNSHLINIAEVAKMGKGKGPYLIMSNNDMLPISNSKKQEIEKILGL